MGCEFHFPDMSKDFLVKWNVRCQCIWLDNSESLVGLCPFSSLSPIAMSK